jgi:NADH-quinone oxidoreductase subunit J
MTFEAVVFYILAGAAIISAILVITRRNPINSVIYLVLNFFILAALYLTLKAQFIAIIQILVYAGAIMVLFMFTIMLLNLGEQKRLTERITLKQIIAIGLATAFALQVIYIVGFSEDAAMTEISVRAADIGTVEFIGYQLFSRYVLPIEAISVLLVAAVVGAIVLAKKKFD